MSLLLAAGSSVAYTLTCNVGTYSLTGVQSTLLKPKLVIANAGNYILSGQSTTLLKSKSIAAQTGGYVLSGNNINIDFTSNQFPINYYDSGKRKVYPLPDILKNNKVEPLKQEDKPVLAVAEPIEPNLHEQVKFIANDQQKLIKKKKQANYAKNAAVQKEHDSPAQLLNFDNLFNKEQQALDLLQQEVENKRIEDELAMKKIMQYFMLM